MEAFENGSLFGRGPGEGIVKLNIPDAHTDFILLLSVKNLVYLSV